MTEPALDCYGSSRVFFNDAATVAENTHSLVESLQSRQVDQGSISYEQLLTGIGIV
jgi:hypothetical protein